MKQNILILIWLPMTLFAQSTDCFIPQKNANISDQKYQILTRSIQKRCLTIQTDTNKVSLANAYFNLATNYAILNVDKSMVFSNVFAALAADTLIGCKLANVFNQSSDYRPYYIATDSFTWTNICNNCVIYQAKQPKRIYKNLNLVLAKQLDSIQKDDQRIRLLVEKLSPNSEEYQVLWQEQRSLDRSNLAKIETIIHQYGYPGKSLVGDSLCDVAFLVIQHSNLQTLEKYLPVFKTAVKAKDLSKSVLYLVVDRIHSEKKNMQLWGTQSFWNRLKKEYESFPIDTSESGQAIKKEIAVL
ncbi:MAG: hypothetical protein RIS64_372 [Bacteroidota bacterium]